MAGRANLTPLIGARTDLAGVADALGRLDRGGAVGKTFVKIDGLV